MTPLATHRDIQESLGVYALDGVDSGERRTIEDHLDICSLCRTEVAEHREVVTSLAATERSAPAGVWVGILEQIAEPTIPPIAGDQTATGRRNPDSNLVPLQRRWIRLVAIAAALVLVGAAAVQTVRLEDVSGQLRADRATVATANQEPARSGLEAAVAGALSDPAARRVALRSQDSNADAVVVLTADGTGYLTRHSLPPLPPDRTYQLWAVVHARVISAGVLGPDPGIVPFRIDIDGFEGFAITEEVAGGVASSTNEPVVAWLDA